MNVLPVVNQETVLVLLRRGWSFRRVARETGVHRETVARLWHERLAPPKPANLPTGDGVAGAAAKPANVPAGIASQSANTEPANLPAGPEPVERAGPPSACAEYAERIREWLELGWTAQKMHQVLVAEHRFAGGYDSVKRYVRRLGRLTRLPFRRMECAPGEEAQLDFCRAGRVVAADGTVRTAWIARVVLSCSRRGYSEAMWRADTATVLAMTERAFAHFDGVVAKLVIDNFKVAVARAEWHDAVLSPRMAEFARHYGVAVLPSAPRMPRHKGKIESGARYVQTALRGEIFPTLEALNTFLLHWETHVADQRIHGTTQEQVRQRFERLERAALQPLPAERFPLFEEGRRRVQQDAYVEVAKAYYSVPPEHVGCEVWVRWDQRLVRLFDERFREIAVHVRGEPGTFVTTAAHIHPHKRNARELGRDALLDTLALIGPRSRTWGEHVLAVRGCEGERAVAGLGYLRRQYDAATLEAAALHATSEQAWHLHHVRDHARALALQHRAGVRLTQIHPLIRDLGTYADLAPFPHEPCSTQTTPASA